MSSTLIPLSVSIQICFSSINMDSWVYPLVYFPDKVTEHPEKLQLFTTNVTLSSFQANMCGLHSYSLLVTIEIWFLVVDRSLLLGNLQQPCDMIFDISSSWD